MPRHAQASLATRLYRRLLLLTAIISVAMALIVLQAARAQIKREADVELLTAATTLYALMAEELADAPADGRTIALPDDLLSDEDLDAFERSAGSRMFMISRGGRRIVGSDTGPAFALLPRTAGFHTVSVRGARWRIYGLAEPRFHLLIQVGEQSSVRDRLILRVATDLALPLAGLIGGSAVLLWLALQGGLFEVRRLSESLAARQPEDVDLFDPADWPSDLAPVVTTLNGLFGRIEDALARERQFTDDAAHQLRTPLAALKLQLQALVRIDEAQARAELTLELTAAIDRAANLVTQMLLLARLDAARLERQRVDVVAVIGEVMAEQAVVAARRAIELDLEVAAAEPVLDADPVVLRLALANLIENAIRYGPGDSIVTIRLTETADRLRIAVIDRGAGIPPDEREAVRQRFHRGRRAHSEGAGLGLAIVTTAIGLIGGTLELCDATGLNGFEAVLNLPKKAELQLRIR